MISKIKIKSLYKSFENILNLVGSDTDEGNIISSIMMDELRHHGMAKKYFLKNYPAMQPWQLFLYRFRETLQNKGRKFYDANLLQSHQEKKVFLLNY